MTGTEVDVDFGYDTDTDEVILRVRGDDTSLTFTGDGILTLAREIKKTRKKAKKNVETKTLTQTLVPVKFKKMKEGKRYRITEKTGISVEITLGEFEEPVEDYGGYSVNTDDYHFYSQDVESVYLIETSEIS